MPEVYGDGQMLAGAGNMASLKWDIASEPGRHIAVPGTLNFRDVGGYPVAGGGFTAGRRLLRSDGLHDLGAGGLEMLGDLGLRTVLDLRTSTEAEIASTTTSLTGAGHRSRQPSRLSLGLAVCLAWCTARRAKTGPA